MKNNLFLSAAAALSLPITSHAFLGSSSGSHPSSRLYQQQYYDQQGGGQYYEGGEGQPQNYEPQQFYDQNGQPQQFYDAQGNPIYAAPPPQQQYDQQQQQQYYPEQQQQQHQQGYDDQNQYNQQGAEEPSLLITDDMQGELAKATSGFEVGGMDYLALARARNEAKMESQNSQATAADWHSVAEEKKRRMGDAAEYAADEDWEKSLEDEGSAADSAVLGMGVQLEQGEGGVMTTEGGLVIDSNLGSGGDDGPQLLL
ncbi:hypothetical protein ACHAXT_009498 [Thalassiosira profunda]